MGDGVACRKASPFCCLADARTRRMGAVYIAANLVMVFYGCVEVAQAYQHFADSHLGPASSAKKKERVLKFGVTRTSEINTPMSESKTYLEGVSTTLIQCN